MIFDSDERSVEPDRAVVMALLLLIANPRLFRTDAISRTDHPWFFAVAVAGSGLGQINGSSFTFIASSRSSPQSFFTLWETQGP